MGSRTLQPPTGQVRRVSCEADAMIAVLRKKPFTGLSDNVGLGWLLILTSLMVGVQFSNLVWLLILSAIAVPAPDSSRVLGYSCKPSHMPLR